MSETKSLNNKSIKEDSGVDVVLPKVLQAKGVSDCVPARTGTCEDLNMVVLQTFGQLGVKRQPAQLRQVFSSQGETKRWSSSRAIRHHTGGTDCLIQNNYLGRVSQRVSCQASYSSLARQTLHNLFLKFLPIFVLFSICQDVLSHHQSLRVLHNPWN